MSSEKLRLYFDSCCFIDLACTQLTYPVDQDGRDEHIWYCKAFLDAAIAKEIEVSTSTLTIAECTHVKDTARQKVMSDDVKRLFRGMMLSGKPILPIQPTPRIVEFARDLKWIHALNILPLDALHVASAIDRGCSAFITTDKRVIAMTEQLKQFNLRICMADALAGQLPDKYKQMRLESKHGKETKPKIAAV